MTTPILDGSAGRRPFASFALPQIEQRVTDCWDDVIQLSQLAEELGHRSRSAARRLRQRVVERIVELGGEPPADPNIADSSEIEMLRTRISELERHIADLDAQLAAKDQAIAALQADSLF